MKSLLVLYTLKNKEIYSKNFIKKYIKTNVKTVLDEACGTALQLREMAKEGM